MTTLVGGLEAAEAFIKPLAWRGVNDEQRELLSRYGRYAEAVKHMPSLKSWASRSAEELNAILAEHGFDIRLDSWGSNPDMFGTVSVNDILVEWLVEGTPKPLQTEFGTYDGFTLPASGAGAVWVEGYDEPVIVMSTKGEEMVYVNIAPDPGDQFGLLDAVESLRKSRARFGDHFSLVHLPMVKLDQQPDLGWVIGLQSGPWSVVQALQQVKFGMNQYGARAMEASAFGLMRGIAPAPTVYKVDRPFLLWMERPDVDVPIFQAYITPEDWKDPGDLAQL